LALQTQDQNNYVDCNVTYKE